MEIHKNDIGPTIKNQLGNLKKSPDDFVWTNIETRLKQKKRRKRLLLFWIFGVFLSSILLATLVFNTSSNHQENNSLNPITNKKDNSIDILDSKNSIKSNTITESSSLNNSLDSHSLSKPQQANKQQGKLVARSKHKVPKVSNHNNKRHLSSKNKENLSIEKSSLSEKSDINKTVIADKIPGNLKDSDTASSPKPTLNKLEQSKNKAQKEKLKDSTPNKKPKKWSIIPQGSLSYFGNFSSKSSDNITANYGILITYTTNDRIFLRLGLRQLKLNQQTNNQLIELEYLELPLDVKYAPLDKKINPYVIGGFSYIVVQDSMNSSVIDLDHSSPSLSVNLGFGVEYELFKDIYINVEPYFNYQINPIINNNDISPFILSVNSGIEYRF